MRVRCLLCDKVLDERGVPGHSRSKEHIAKGGVAGTTSDEAVMAVFEEVDIPTFAEGLSEAEAAPSEFVASITDPPDDGALDELERRLAEAEAKAAAALLRAEEAEAEAQAASPVKEIPILTAENAAEVLGEEAVQKQAEDRVAAQNRKRLKEGYPAVDPHDPAYKDWVEEEKVKVIEESIANQTRWVKGRPGEGIKTKTLKMIHPTTGLIVQIIAERQVNSKTGGANENIQKQRDKGYKIATPLRCYLYDCYAPASVDSSGRLTNGGYCCAEHKALIDGQMVRQKDDRDQTLSSIGYAGRHA